jgi:hypothetical protein
MHDCQNLNAIWHGLVVDQVIAGHVATYLTKSPVFYSLSDVGLSRQQITSGSHPVEPGHCREQIVLGNVV